LAIPIKILKTKLLGDKSYLTKIEKRFLIGSNYNTFKDFWELDRRLNESIMEL
jgi:hypothetical protein